MPEAHGVRSLLSLVVDILGRFDSLVEGGVWLQGSRVGLAGRKLDRYCHGEELYGTTSLDIAIPLTGTDPSTTTASTTRRLRRVNAPPRLSMFCPFYYGVKYALLRDLISLTKTSLLKLKSLVGVGSWQKQKVIITKGDCKI